MLSSLHRWIAVAGFAALLVAAGCVGPYDDLDGLESDSWELDEDGAPATEDSDDSMAPIATAVVFPAPQPDLQVSSFVITAPPRLHCGMNQLWFGVRETNAGSGNAGAHYLAVWNPANPAYPTAVLSRPPLAANSFRDVTLSASLYGGPCDCIPGCGPNWNFTLETDYLNSVAESNEFNNWSNADNIGHCCP